MKRFDGRIEVTDDLDGYGCLIFYVVIINWVNAQEYYN